MASETLTPADVLRKAKERLTEYWWDGSHDFKPGHRVNSCLIFGTAHCLGFVNVIDSADRAAELLGFPSASAGFTFNDTHSKDEVLAKLDERIAFYEGGGQ